MIYLLHADGTQTDLSSLKTREFVTVGSSSSCDLRLPAKGVAGLHCRVLNVRGWLYVQPVSSRHPVSVNGLPVAGREQRLHKGDKLTVGEWNMIYFEEAADVEDEGAAAAARPDIGENAGAREQLKRKVHEILLDRMDLKSLDTIGAAASLELRQRARKLIGEIIGELSAEAERQGVAADVLQKEVVHDVLGFGPLDDLINDPDITEIMCFGRNKIFVERKGRLAPSNRKFDSPGQLEAIIERIVGPLGRRIDESSPIVDARLPDGSRVNAVISPVAIDGASLDIRKFPAKPLTIEDLVGFKTLSPAMAAFLRIAVERRQNTVISGGTASPIRSSSVGARSASRPLRSRAPAGPPTSATGTRLVVCAVCGPPVTGSIIVSQLPWSAVMIIAPPAASSAARTRPRSRSISSQAAIAAGRLPVWPTISGLA